jgi:hypothetical protein
LFGNTEEYLDTDMQITQDICDPGHHGIQSAAGFSELDSLDVPFVSLIGEV